MMKKKILFVMFSLPSGGAEHALLNLFNTIDKEKYEISLFLFKKVGDLIDDIPEFVNILEESPIVLDYSFLLDKKRIFKQYPKIATGYIKYEFSKIIHKRKSLYYKRQLKWKYVYSNMNFKINEPYDVAVGYLQTFPSYFVIDNIVNAKKKYLWVHFDYKDFCANKKYDEYYFKKADKVISVSDACVKSLQEYFPTIQDKFIKLENINPESQIIDKSNLFYPEEYKEKKDMILVSIGRLAKQKGFDFAINTALELKKLDFKFHWFILGEGSERNYLQSLIDDNQLNDFISLIGIKKNPYPYIKNADLVIQTSISEGKSIVLDEAKILCKPILSTNYYPVEDQIKNNVNGAIVERNTKIFAVKIVQLCNDEIIKNLFIANLKKEEFKSKEIIKKHYKLFDCDR